ncbi:hypothetical protein H9P43_004494 [Blastocladiella emersonii ATCC 22665]|nr:hypothetical protein H9P43_004494 [Blastocladiella emersonii ATCC 22665]
MTIPATETIENPQAYWEHALMGKVLVDGPVTQDKNGTVYSKSNLPSSHRILTVGGPMTLDLRTDRLNITVDEEMRVIGVFYGY